MSKSAAAEAPEVYTNEQKSLWGAFFWASVVCNHALDPLAVPTNLGDLSFEEARANTLGNVGLAITELRNALLVLSEMKAEGEGPPPYQKGRLAVFESFKLCHHALLLPAAKGDRYDRWFNEFERIATATGPLIDAAEDEIRAHRNEQLRQGSESPQGARLSV